MDQPKGRDSHEPDAPTETAGARPMLDNRTPSSAGMGPPTRIGRYHIKREIASGGMGTVYEATQENPRRVVALKVMKHGVASRSALRRFEYEAQLLGRLRHPGIAQVYDAGTHRDERGTLPYFAMEYIPNARPITNYARDKKLGTRERMKLFAQVCDAVHHGHQKGIIHRDLKPSNILVDSGGQVKVIDFGVARSTDSDLAVTTLQTDVGQLIGTLQYMSPEQCEADPHDIDIRSDVYALGVVFYELLAGRPPYDIRSKAIHEATRAIRESQPTRLSTLDRTLRGDVETIALKALEKERDRRYQSATDFGQDIERYLNNEAITARRPSLTYQLRVFARRNRAACLAVTAIMVVLFSATVVSSVLYLRADRERQRAVAAEQSAVKAAEKADSVSAFLQNMLSTANPYESGDRSLLVVDMLDRASEMAAEQLSGQPEVEASIRRTIGETYRRLALHEEGERELRRSIELAVTSLGEDQAFVADTLNDLFWLLEKDGNYPGAEKVCQRALAIRRRLYGEDHPAVAESLDALGDLYRYMGNLEKAEATLLGAQAIYAKLPGPTPHNFLNDFALVLRDQARFTEAEPLFIEAIEISQLESGEDHPQTHLYWANLAEMFTWDSRFADAEEILKRTSSAWEASLGSTHPFTLMALHHLAENQVRLGHLEEAERAAGAAVEGYRSTLEEENVEFAHALTILGTVQIRLRKYSDAERTLREALAIRQRIAPESWRTSETKSLLGEAIASDGRFAEAEPLLLESYDGISGRTLVTYAEREALLRITTAYEKQHTAEPSKGYDAKAAQWRAKLPDG